MKHPAEPFRDVGLQQTEQKKYRYLQTRRNGPKATGKV